jgi:methylenetetrahydrofolate reductase (NADPH)
MFNYPYLVELLTPKRSPEDQIEGLLDRFAQRYRRIVDAGLGLSIPDNPMGQPRMGALESIASKQLPIDPEKVVMNLNTFHTKPELDGLLAKAVAAGLKYILVVRGDGGPLLPKLDPQHIGGQRSVATSIDLIRYIHNQYPDQFVTGAAFNPYKPMPVEFNRLQQKIDAGATYVVTQPVIGSDAHVLKIMALNISVVVEAWMSINTDLLFKSVGKEKDKTSQAFDPIENLNTLHDSYPGCCVYLSMLSFKKDWQTILPKLSR